MSAAPLGADTGGPGPVGHGRVLAYTRSGEDRRKRLETRVPLGWWCDDNHDVLFLEHRTGTERRVALTAPDGRIVRCDKPPSQCGEYGGTHQPGKPNAFCDCRCHDTIDSAEDIDYESVDFVHSILQAEIDRDLLARVQHPGYRRNEHEHAGLGVRPVQGKRWQLFRRWGRALRRRIPSSCFYVASPGLQWGSERGATGGAR